MEFNNISSSEADSRFLNYISDNILVLKDSERRISFRNDYKERLQEVGSVRQSTSSSGSWKRSREGLDAALMSRYLKKEVV